MKLIQYPITPSQQVEGISLATIREFRGLNTFDPLSIADSFWTDVVNLDSSNFPTATVRPGYTVLGATIGSKVIGLGSWKDTELHAVFNDGTWRKWTGTAWTTLKSGLDTSVPWSFTNFQGNLDDINLIGCNGFNGLHRYDGSTVQTFGNAPADINYITTYQNRLWGASGKELHSCALDRPAEWKLFGGTEEDSYVKDIESDRGENINMLSGGLSKLTIGLPNSLRELFGGLPSDFNDRLVTEDAGFASNRAAVTHDGILRFLHNSGIYEYGGGSLPSKDFYEAIGNYPLSVDSSASSGTDGQSIYFQAAESTLVFDTRTDVYTWNVWKGINATCFIRFKGELYCGDNLGRVLKLSGTTDAGSPINWRGTLKPFSSSTLAQKLRWYKLWVIAELAAGSTMNVYMSRSVNGDDWKLVQTATGNGLGASRILIPVGKYALENWVRVKFEGTGWARLHEFSRQTRPMPLQ